MPNRLSEQINFIVEIDKVKTVFRKTYLISKERFENDAEHSWHLALLILTLKEYANQDIDVLKTVKMVLIHDLVEIDTGDTFLYDTEGRNKIVEQEKKAAKRIFGLLPYDQGKEYMRLWEEFEERKTPEAKFAAVCDRLQPIIHNVATEGRSWRENNITAKDIIEQTRHVKEGSIYLWDYIKKLIKEAVERGYIKEK